MDTLWTTVITQPQSIVVGKHFTATIVKLLNVISRIPIIQLLPVYFCTNSSWNVRASVCLEGRFFVVSIMECLQPDRGGWELIDSHGAGTGVCPFTTGRGIYIYIYIYIYVYIYICIYIYINCVLGSLISDVTCNYVSADGGRDGLWWTALLGHWLSYSGCCQSLLVMYWLMFGIRFLFQPPP